MCNLYIAGHSQPMQLCFTQTQVIAAPAALHKDKQSPEAADSTAVPIQQLCWAPPALPQHQSANTGAPCHTSPDTFRPSPAPAFPRWGGTAQGHRRQRPRRRVPGDGVRNATLLAVFLLPSIRLQRLFSSRALEQLVESRTMDDLQTQPRAALCSNGPALAGVQSVDRLDGRPSSEVVDRALGAQSFVRSFHRAASLGMRCALPGSCSSVPGAGGGPGPGPDGVTHLRGRAVRRAKRRVLGPLPKPARRAQGGRVLGPACACSEASRG